MTDTSNEEIRGITDKVAKSPFWMQPCKSKYHLPNSKNLVDGKYRHTCPECHKETYFNVLEVYK